MNKLIDLWIKVIKKEGIEKYSKEVKDLYDYTIQLEKENQKLEETIYTLKSIEFSMEQRMIDVFVSDEMHKRIIDKAIEYIGLTEEDLENLNIYDVNGVELYKILKGEKNE